jgi:hypothetical protein
MLRSLKFVWILTAAAIFAAVLPATASPTTGTHAIATTASHATALKGYGQLPLAFEKNEGQADASVRFLSRGRGYAFALTPKGAALRLNGAKDESATVSWNAVGANPNARITGESVLPGTSNYFHGNDPKQWHTGVVNYSSVRYASIYQGVDLVYHGNHRQVEYDFIVAPNANPKQIRLAFQGVESVRIGDHGELILHTALGDLVQPRPTVYQELDGRRQIVDGRYTKAANNQVGFALGDYDHNRALVIDPVLLYSTFFGGTDFEEGLTIDIDSSGNAYITGLMVSYPFPGISGSSIQSTPGGDYDSFVTKINAAGTAVIYSTYLGGDGGNEYSESAAVDASGNIYVTGGTNSSNFPGVTGGSIQSSFGGGWRDGFLTKINAAGNAIVYSTYLGGTDDDLGTSVAVDSSGNAVVVGFTGSSSFPAVSGSSLQPTYGGNGDAFVVKVDPTGTAIYSTYLGGTGGDGALSVALDSSSNAYIAGGTDTSAFPGVSGSSLQSSHAGSGDAFITKLNAAGSAIVWSTYLGGTAGDSALGIALDSSGNIVVAGSTDSTSFPGVTGSSLQPTHAGSNEQFVTKINSGGTAILWSTFLGGNDYDFMPWNALALDGSDNVYIGGGTLTTSYPGVNGSSIQPTFGGASDAFVVKINAAGTAIVYATYLGGTGDDSIYAIAVDASGNLYATGSTDSTTFPGVDGSSLQPAYGGGTGDAFIVKIGELGSPTLSSISPSSGYPGTQVTFNGTNFGATQGSSSVWLGSKAAGSIVSWSNTQIVAVVASGAASGSAIVQQGGVWSNSIAFTVITPAITSISPTSGYPGTQVTFTGTNFGATQGSGSVWLGSKLAGSIVSWSDTQVVAVVASGAASGSAQIQQNGVWGNSIVFTVITPTITSITPTSGVAGTQVTYTGTNFGSTQGSGSVWLGSKLAGSIVSWSNTQIVATVASGSVTGSAQVQQNGVWGNTIAFTVTSPNLTGVSPTTARAGDQITLTGTNFGSTQGSGSVWLGNKLAGSIVSWSSTQIVAVVASGAKSGSAQVQQSGVWSNAISFTVITPVESGISPTSGPVGTQVTITGTGFGATQGSGLVWIGTKYAAVVSWSDTQVVATVATGSATGGTQVYQNGVWSNAITFTVTP